MKLPIAFSIVALAIGIMSQRVLAQRPATDNTGGIVMPGSGTTGSTGARPTPPPSQDNTDEQDDTLYRGRTSDGLDSDKMFRDGGALHEKPRAKERVQEVDSLKKLQSSGTDPKFQSNLLYSGASIEKITAKANETGDAADEEDPRFKTKRLVFTAEKTDGSKQAQSNSTPSPTPSPTASPAAKNPSKE